MRIPPALWFAIAALLLLLSLPGIPEQIRLLAELIGMAGAEWYWWNYVGICIALILFFLSAYPLWRRITCFVGENRVTVDWALVRANAKALAGLVLMALMLALIGGGIYYVVFVHDPTRTVWDHPTLSPAEQSQGHAECRMKAYEAIEGSRFSDDQARSDYTRSCLVSRGFVSREVKKSILENSQ